MSTTKQEVLNATEAARQAAADLEILPVEEQVARLNTNFGEFAKKSEQQIRILKKLLLASIIIGATTTAIAITTLIFGILCYNIL